MVIVPEVFPVKDNVPKVVPATPKVGVAEYAGAVPTPPDVRTLPTATSARLPTVFAADAYSMSPAVAVLGYVVVLNP
jgi:hypothetical protein